MSLKVLVLWWQCERASLLGLNHPISFGLCAIIVSSLSPKLFSLQLPKAGLTTDFYHLGLSEVLLSA